MTNEQKYKESKKKFMFSIMGMLILAPLMYLSLYIASIGNTAPDYIKALLIFVSKYR